jgi:hypothetical protein
MQKITQNLQQLRTNKTLLLCISFDYHFIKKIKFLK